jgi:hypothetical protein
MKPNLVLEPLVDPVVWPGEPDSARYRGQKHYRATPANHRLLHCPASEAYANAVKNPKLRGGSFVDYDCNRVEEISALRDRTKRRTGPFERETIQRWLRHYEKLLLGMASSMNRSERKLSLLIEDARQLWWSNGTPWTPGIHADQVLN